MRTNIILKAITTLFLFTGIQGLVSAQQVPKANADKDGNCIKIRMVKNINGVETVFDTLIKADDMALPDLDMNIGMELEKMGKTMRLQIDSFTMNMPDIHFDMPDMEDLHIELSAELDSLAQEISLMGEKMMYIDAQQIDIRNGIPDSNITIRVLDTNDPDYDRIMKELNLAEKDMERQGRTIMIITDTDHRTENVKGGKKAGSRLKTEITFNKVIIKDTDEGDKKVLGDKEGSAEGNLSVEKINFYPNPGNGKFNLDFELAKRGDTDIAIYSTEGKKVYHETLAGFTGKYNKVIDITGNASGIYYLHITQGKNSFFKKIILE